LSRLTQEYSLRPFLPEFSILIRLADSWLLSDSNQLTATQRRVRQKKPVLDADVCGPTD